VHIYIRLNHTLGHKKQHAILLWVSRAGFEETQ
jgi:hypothetical protein